MIDKFDLLVFIGRFQPVHNEHVRVIDEALQRAKKVLVLVGSSGKARTIRNPFTYQERKQMIQNVFNDSRIIIRPIFDKTYNDVAWIKQIQDTVHSVALDVVNDGGFHTHGLKDIKIGLIGASKDHTSYYLKLFPQWNSINVDVHHDLSSTDIRESYFVDDLILTPELPTAGIAFLQKFYNSESFITLKNEFKFTKNYKKSWAAAPYPVKHMTVDAVVEQSGHVLVIRRRSAPGKGLWALPGGHLNEFEKLEDGAIRELREETGIKVPDPVLRGSIVAHRTFDDPYRSTIGRVITQAYHIKLRDDVTLPKIKGMDDADKAKWIPISELKEEEFFDDHFHIISYFLGI